VTAETALARCLRAQGFLKFPDPTASGQITHQMLATTEINLHRPVVMQPPTRVSASPTD
jgi:hypothetical protein